MRQPCSHLKQVRSAGRQPAIPGSAGCKECIESGDGWVHLRLCLACGHVGCCDDSPNKHASAHYRSSGHPVIKSFEPGEDWAWCFVDHQGLEAIGAFPEESPSHHYSAPGAQPP